MDRIYAGAYVTIVASSSENAHSGLPGVSRISRKRQPSTIISSQRFTSTLPPLPSALKDSVWLSRGWTYQEAILSRRCLFFTNIQVYFVCAKMTCCEAVISGIDDMTLRSPSKSKVLNSKIFNKITPITGMDYLSNHITQYSSRNLSFDSDALDAFRGVLSRANFYSYYGIPIGPTTMRGPGPFAYSTAKEVNAGFTEGLFWLPVRTHDESISFYMDVFNFVSRRSEFPSWSWTGWKGPVQCPANKRIAVKNKSSPFEGKSNGRITTASPSFLVETKNRKRLIPLAKLYYHAPRTGLIDELSKYIHLDAMVINLRFQSFQQGGDSRDPLMDQRYGVCRCHPDSQHEFGTPFSCWGEVIFCQNPNRTNVTFRQRLESESWTCILLLETWYQEVKRVSYQDPKRVSYKDVECPPHHRLTNYIVIVGMRDLRNVSPCYLLLRRSLKAVVSKRFLLKEK